MIKPPLYSITRQCNACSLRARCKGPVPAVGPTDARVMIVGEAPGANEDIKGEPWVGHAGMYLDELLRKAGLTREEVMFSNTVKCRPEGNDTPTYDQAQFCGNLWLKKEIELYQPEIIMALGKVATEFFMGKGESIEHRHGIAIQLEGENDGTEYSNGISVSVGNKGISVGVRGFRDATDVGRGLDSTHNPAESKLRLRDRRQNGLLLHGKTNSQTERIPVGARRTILLPAYHPAAGFYETANMRWIAEDFDVLGRLVRGERIERVEDVFKGHEAYHEVAKTHPVTYPLIGLDTETVGDQLWSVQTSGKEGTGLFYSADQWHGNLQGKKVVVHGYFYDSKFVDLPEDTDCTMVMAYVLGRPQGLKELAWRLCGMAMKSYSETISGHRKGKALDYLERAVRGLTLESEQDAKIRGMALAEAAAGPWKNYAWELIKSLAIARVTFSANDVNKQLGVAGIEVDHTNAMGSLFHRAAHEGFISGTGIVQSEPEGRHRSIIQTWVGTGKVCDWPDPEPISTIKWSNKTNSFAETVRQPQHITKKIKKILADVASGKELKDGPVDPWKRWHDVDERERADVERSLGAMPASSLADIPRDEAVYYSARDPDATLRVYGVLNKEIDERGVRFAYEIDRQTLPIAREMEDNGIKVDLPHLKALSARFVVMLQSKSEEIFHLLKIRCPKCDGRSVDCSHCRRLGYWRFNPNSDQELQKLFFGSKQDGFLGFKPTRLTKKTRMPSVEEDELAKIKHPVVKLIKEYRHIAHLKQAFSDPLQTFADEESKIHTTINTTRVATGRWSMKRPNLMQIPVRTELGRELRKAFTSSAPDWSLFAADYSQIEMRVAAHLSNCASMIDIFEQNRDIHTETAAQIFGIRPEDVTSKERYPAKTTGFGVIYGLTGMGLWDQMQKEGQDQWSEKDCDQFIIDYYKTKPELKDWQDNTLSFARLNGYVKDIFGRIRYTPEMGCPIPRYRGDGERKAVNMPVQSSAQGILKLAMVQLWKSQANREFKWLLQIHDEILIETPDSEGIREWMVPIMENVVQLRVPVVCESKSGPNWKEMEPWLKSKEIS